MLEKEPLMKKMKSKALANCEGESAMEKQNGIIMVLREGQSKWKLEIRVLNKQKILSSLRTGLIKCRHLNE